MTETPRTYTADELVYAIGLALEARDFEAAVALLKMLAVVDPRQAQAVLDVVRIAVVLA